MNVVDRKEIIENDLGYTMGVSVRSFGFVLIVVGCCIIAFSSLHIIDHSLEASITLLVGAIITFIGGFMRYSKNRNQIDLNTRRIRDINYYLGLQLGSWKPMPDFVDICILRRQIGTRVYSYSMNSTSRTDVYFDIYILTENHRQKWLIRREVNEHDAVEARNSLAVQLEMRRAVFNPVVPSRNRRR